MSQPSYLVISPAIPEPLDAADAPLVSFCIPTKNRERTIEACLQSIRAQVYPRLEIIVIDNGSTDRTAEIARRYADVVEHSDQPLGAVRQRSIELSRGGILAMFDDDIILPHPQWLSRAVAAFQLDSGASTVWPVLIPPCGANWVTRCFFDLNEAIFLARRRRSSAAFGGGNSLFRRSAVDAIGGFRPDLWFCDDFEIAIRLKEAGFRVILHADPLIHDTMFSLPELYRKQQWGAGSVVAHGIENLGQSYWDAFYEQYLVGFGAMLRGLIIERKPWWLAYPLLVGAKTIPYARAIVTREFGAWKRQVAQ
ncbi:MAG TPA: glycosyltransferase family 2 protein [Roseiflexaceae bacterium]|nr:glycosyltransferase family 2 protein [Roseiflexaceae bacterium]